MALPKEVALSPNEWYNLLNALKVIIERYGIEEVALAIEHFKVTGTF